MVDYTDNFCTISDMGNGKAFYADRSMTAFQMPIRWAEKIIELFNQGNIKKACHYLDMVRMK